ncbi:DUF4105 domain-containing protein [Niveibacterium sp. SC-1]|uniref:Lnb N-terminal periplasmic domain-containing protein n=1 Tax=Niveibacterium sp. SC-1 TaxID=3135646 RepID=UPI00311FE9E6
MRRASRFILFPVLFLLTLWAIAALAIDTPLGEPFRTALAILYALAAFFCVLRLRPARRASLALLLGFLIVLAAWLSLAPSNSRDWLEDVSQPPSGSLVGDVLTLHNVRNFSYHGTDTSFTPVWETRQYALDKLTGVELFVSNWGPTLYAHTILSWQFADAPPLAVSIETRKEKGESYSAVLGFFRQYELYFVAADERDVIGVRTNFRGEHVRRYRLRANPAEARALLMAYVADMNRLAEQPRWYNALTSNCTTVIFRLVHTLRPTISPWHWQVLANGYLDKWLYEHQFIDSDKSFEQLRETNDVTERAKAARDAADFSRRIREG